MALTAIFTAISGAKAAFDSLTGGGTSDDVWQGGTPCPGQPATAAVSVAWSNAPEAVKQALVAAYMSGNNGQPPPPPIGNGPNPYPGTDGVFAFAKALMGGADCVNKSNPQAPQMLKDMVARYGGGAASPVYSGEALQQAYVTNTGEKSLGDYLREVGDNVLKTAENIAKATIGGAVQGATVSTQGAATGAQVGTQFQMLWPILLVGAGVGAVMLLRRK